MVYQPKNSMSLKTCLTERGGKKNLQYSLTSENDSNGNFSEWICKNLATKLPGKVAVLGKWFDRSGQVFKVFPF